MQNLSFALTHVYARATRSVSIPAPVYCKPWPGGIVMKSTTDFIFWQMPTLSVHVRGTITLLVSIWTARMWNHRLPEEQVTHNLNGIRMSTNLFMKESLAICILWCVFFDGYVDNGHWRLSSESFCFFLLVLCWISTNLYYIPDSYCLCFPPTNINTFWMNV